METVAHLPHVYVVRILPPKARSTSETKGAVEVGLWLAAPSEVAEAAAAVELEPSCSLLVALPIESLEPRTESPTLCGRII